jgi:hypothetical protein
MITVFTFLSPPEINIAEAPRSVNQLAYFVMESTGHIHQELHQTSEGGDQIFS